MFKSYLKKIIDYFKNQYNAYKEDIIIGFIIATIIGILFKATVNTWFISLWITLFFQIIKVIIERFYKKTKSSLKIHQILIHFIIGIYISLLFLIW